MVCGGWIDMRTDINAFFRQCDVDYMQFLKDPQGGKKQRGKSVFLWCIFSPALLQVIRDVIKTQKF